MASAREGETAASIDGGALPRRLDGIDLVRAVAALAVTGAHVVKADALWGGQGRASFPVDSGAAGAWGVGLFFVLSGLCIHLPMARRLAVDPNTQLAISPYMRRRFTRIYPPHLIVLIMSMVVALGLRSVGSDIHEGLSVPTWAQFVAHIAMVHTFVPGAQFSINNVLWTIALETHFYLLYPLILRVRRRLPMGIIVVVLLGVALLSRYADARVFPDWLRGVLTTNFPGRFWEWVLGCAVAERLVAQREMSWVRPLPVAAFLVATFLFGATIVRAPFGMHVRDVMWPPFFALTIHMAARLAPSKSRIARAAIEVGRRSYSLYLVHPIAISLVVFVLTFVSLPVAANVALAVVSCFLMTSLFFAWVEDYFLRAATRPNSVRAL
jgi:peptidoglycan/LPS O-acetylase OafA/YrhL